MRNPHLLAQTFPQARNASGTHQFNGLGPPLTEYRAAYEKIRDALRGQDRVQAQGQLYLPKPEGMSADSYSSDLKRASFYVVSERTRDTGAGSSSCPRPIRRAV